MRECYPDRLGVVTTDVLDRVGDQFSGNDLGVVRVPCTASKLSAGTLSCGFGLVGRLRNDRGSCLSVCCI